MIADQNLAAYDPGMATILAGAVSAAYKKYQNPSWKLQFGQYTINPNYIYAFEAGQGGYTFFGFSAYGSYTGQPPYNNILALRGTQTAEESFYDISDWNMVDCVLPYSTGSTYGKVASGLYDFYVGDDGGLVTSLATSFKAAVSSMDGSKGTWYAAAHSLGGAMVTLGALDAYLSGSFPNSSAVPQVYTYGGLHVGDQNFANAFVANGITDFYRLVNLADWVPGFTGMTDDTPGYVHVGKQYAFLWQTGHDWANHSLDNIYIPTLTLHPQVISPNVRKYPNSGSQ